MKRLSSTWFAPWLSRHPGIAWCAAWFAIPALAAFGFAAFTQTGAVGRVFLLLVGGVHAFAALGLLRGVKAGWNVATFLAFLTIVTRVVAVACAPGEIADGERHLLEAGLDVAVLAIAIVIFAYLRKPAVRSLYSVPLDYRISPEQ